MLRTQTTNPQLAADAARRKLTGDLEEFVAGSQLSEFTRPYRVLPAF
jgi:hypothetical protein